MRQLLAGAVLVLLPVALAALVGGAVCLFRGEHAPAGPAARALIEHERDRYHAYYPDTVLLSPGGQRLRHVGMRLLWAGGVTLASAMAAYEIAARF